jgi:hypothetical protein
MKRWFGLSLAALLLVAGGARAQDDSSANLPGGFGEVIAKTRGVVVRVPINARGEENTAGAEKRFYQGDEAVTKSTAPEELWAASKPAGASPEVMGTNAPAGDSSTWGWYYWYNTGWYYPYYFSYYYPTYYWNYNYYYYNYYWNWSWYGYRYYYYYSYW